MSALHHHTVGLKASIPASGGTREGQVVRTGKALPSAFGRKRRNELRGRLSVHGTAPTNLCSVLWGVADEGGCS